MPKLVLFDIDGTLLSTHGAGMRAMRRAGQRLFGDDFSFDGVRIAGNLDPWIFAEAVDAHVGSEPSAHADAFEAAYQEELTRELDEPHTRVRSLPGIDALVHALHGADGVGLGMVTGNYARTAPLKLRAAGLAPDLFRFNGFGDEAEDRPGLVRLALARFQSATGASVTPADAIVIGDTPSDVHCAKVNGAVCLAVATGYYDRETLLWEGADVAVDHLEGGSALWRLLGL